MPSRPWVPGGTEQAGAWGRDEIRNITGMVSVGGASNQNAVIALADGAFSVEAQTVAAYIEPDASGAVRYSRFVMNVSNVVPTGSQNVPQHIWLPHAIYLGLTV